MKAGDTGAYVRASKDGRRLYEGLGWEVRGQLEYDLEPFGRDESRGKHVTFDMVRKGETKVKATSEENGLFDNLNIKPIT